MGTKGMTDKERALLQAARREVAAKASRREVVDTAALPGSSSHRSSSDKRVRRREAPKLSPLDAQTVLGWDHPAAQQPASAAEDQWSRIGDLLEAERRAAAARRAKVRRRTMIFLACLFAVAVIVAARALTR
jgi:hypothetical protein